MKPIIMSTNEVRGILNGLKTMKRMPVKFGNGSNPSWTGYIPDGAVLYGSNNVPEAKSPIRPGDVLWVRETWGDYGGQTSHYIYRADYPLSAKGYWHEKEHINWCDFPKWESPVTMPREAVRLFLRVTDVRVERLKNIPEDDVVREGFCDEHSLKTDIVCPDGHRFRVAWDARNAKRGHGWDSNPFVWVISFERLE